MSHTRRSQVNSLLLGLLMLGVWAIDFAARDAVAGLPPLAGHHAGMGGATFPSREVLPWVEVRLADLAVWLVGALWALETLPLLLPECRRPRPWVIGALQALVVVALILNMELVARQILWPLRSAPLMAPHATRYWTFNRYTSDNRFSINRHGLRGVEINPHRQPGEFRILVLGNSISAGDNLAENQTYPFHLQAYLRKRCPGTLIRVQNGAVNGYSCLQGVMVYQEVAEEFQPDLVILGMSYFDVNLVDENGNPRLTHRWPLNRVREAAFESMLYLTLRQSSQMHLDGSSGLDPLDTRMDSGNMQDPENLTARYFMWFVDEARRKGFQLVLYTTYAHFRGTHMVPKPPLENPVLRSVYRQMHRNGQAVGIEHLPPGIQDTVRKQAQDRLAWLFDVPQVDLDRSWRMKPDIANYLQDETHPNVPGTVMQAEDIGRFLLERGLVPGARPDPT